MSIPAPVTINKGMIYCDNIPGPMVNCYGQAGAVDPNAKVTIKVQPPGYASPKFWEGIFFGTAYALPGFTASGLADAAGAFGPISVLATTGEVLEIQACLPGGACSSRLLLTVPIEGSSVSGSSGTIKLLTVDPDGNTWMSRNESIPSRPRRAWSWKSLFISEAQAASTEPSPRYADCAGQAVDRPALQSEIDSVSGNAVIRRNLAGQGEIVDAISLPHLQQADVRVIRPFQVGPEKYLAVGAGQRLFILRVTNPEQVQWVQEIRYPYPIQEIWNFGALYVFLGGDALPAGADRLYKVFTEVSGIQWTSGCFDYEGAFNNLQSVTGADSMGLAFAVVGRFSGSNGKPYRLIVGRAEPNEFIFNNLPEIIFQSDQPFAVKFLKEDAVGFTLAVLDSMGKRLAFFHREWVSLGSGGNPLDRSLNLTDLSQASGPWQVGQTSQLNFSPARGELAFFNILDQRVELILLPYSWGAGGDVQTAQVVQVHAVGDVVPNVLGRDDAEGRDGWILVRPNGDVQRFLPTAD